VDDFSVVLYLHRTRCGLRCSFLLACADILLCMFVGDSDIDIVEIIVAQHFAHGISQVVKTRYTVKKCRDTPLLHIIPASDSFCPASFKTGESINFFKS